jgi:UDP-glucose 4-epimerase
MSRVLITGGAGSLGAAVARLLLADPDYDVRISDARPAARWMREGCEMHRGDLRSPPQASAAIKGCSHVIHLACFDPEPGRPLASAGLADAGEKASGNGSTPAAEPAGPPAGAADSVIGAGDASTPYALLAYESALHGAVLRAALERGVARLLYVSSPLVFERAELFPTPEDHLADCPAPRSARGFASLSGERLCAAARSEHGLRCTICRPFGAYGPAPAPAAEPAGDARPPLLNHELGLSELIERAAAGKEPLAVPASGADTLTPTHFDDLAAGILAALSSPAAADEDFNLGAGSELSLDEIAQIAWRAGADASGAQRAEAPALTRLPAADRAPARSFPSVAKARQLLGWEAQINAVDGIAELATRTRERPASPAGRTIAGD